MCIIISLFIVTVICVLDIHPTELPSSTTITMDDSHIVTTTDDPPPIDQPNEGVKVSGIVPFID